MSPTQSTAAPSCLRESASSGPYCVIGAGSSGLAVAKNLRASRIPFECIEREDDVGGNWYFGRPQSSVYRSTRLISSKRETEYTDFPMPEHWPEHPGHELVWQYLRSYARHFDLYRHIRFNTSVIRIEPADDAAASVGGERERGRELVERATSGVSPSPPLPVSPSAIVPSAPGWDVVLSDDTRRRYRGVVIANGHNWDPRWPDFPGSFAGKVLHSSQYKSPELCHGARVLVVGGGNSGFDIAADVAPWAAATWHSMRRRYHVLPRYLRGVPIDQCGQWALRWRLPLWLRRLSARRARRVAWGAQVSSSLPQADHRLFETHPVINSRWPYDVARGAIRVKPDVRRLDGDAVVFSDGSRETVDVIIYATGYKLSFPFLDRRHLNWRSDRPELYLNVFHPERDDLFVAGMIQPDSGQFGLVDYQAQLIAAYIRARDDAHPAARLLQAKKRQCAGESLSGGIRYIRSPRHLVEVEHDSYRRLLRRWIARFQVKPTASSFSKGKLHAVDAQIHLAEDALGSS